MKNSKTDNLYRPLWAWIKESCNCKLSLRHLPRVFSFPLQPSSYTGKSITAYTSLRLLAHIHLCQGLMQENHVQTCSHQPTTFSNPHPWFPSSSCCPFSLHKVSLTLITCSLNMEGYLQSKSIFLTYFGREKRFKQSEDTMKIYTGWLHDEEPINTDPREEVIKSSFTPSFQRSQRKMNWI